MKTRLRRTGLAFGAVALIVVGGLATAAPASADGSVCVASCAGEVNFKSSGEIFTVHDYKADGLATVGYLEYEAKDGTWKVYPAVWNHNGEAGAPVVKNYSIAEGTQVAYWVCTANNGSLKDCSLLHFDTA